jgi:hypothetical protein
MNGCTYHEKTSLQIPPKISIPQEMGKNANIHVLAIKSTTSLETQQAQMNVDIRTKSFSLAPHHGTPLC